MSHAVTVHRGPQHRWWACTCGWQGDPIPYGTTGAAQAAAAIRHQTNLEQEPT